MTEFETYDRITDTVMYISDNITLEFVLSLSKKMKSGDRNFFHSDITYNSERYLGTELHSIKRQMNSYYFVLNNKEVFSNGFLIRPQDQELLIMFINNNILPWFFDNNRNAFQLVKGKLALKEYTQMIYTQSELKYISFDPCIISYEDDTYDKGIKLGINGNNICELSVDKFMGFYSIIKNTDMYGAACSLANYVKAAPYNINTYKPTGLGANKNPNINWNNSSDNKNKKGNNFLDNKK